MYTAIRCPRCLVTIYTVFSPGGGRFNVESLADESLMFYNCPVALCEYHFDTNYDVNLYTNAQRYHRAFASPGFTMAPLTDQTQPFRSRAQVVDLAIAVEIPQDEPRNPHATVLETQAGDKAQPARVEEENGQGDASTPKQNRSSRFLRWTPAEILELERMMNKGCGHDEIAKVMDRSASAVKNKIAAMRDKGDLPVQTTQLKRKRVLRQLTSSEESLEGGAERR